MSATEARERLLADSQFGAGAQGSFAPATWYLGVSTTVPADDGTGFTEPSGGSYARVAITNNATNWPAAATADGVTTKKNGAKFTFVNPTGNWGLLIWWGLFTASTGGQPQYVGENDQPISPRSGNSPVEFDINQIIIEFD
jgi:hypothetical protein